MPENNFPFLVSSIDFKEKKRKSIIIIFGSYDSRSINRLKKFRTRIKQEFDSAKLVQDMKYPEQKQNQTFDSHIYQKSLYWVENAEILIWVYYIDSDKSGESMEIGAMPFLQEEYSNVIIVRETTKIDKDPPMTSLLKGLIETHREITIVDFELNKDEIMVEDVIGSLRRMID